MRPRRCLWCKAPTPPSKRSGKPRAYCSRACSVRGASARYYGTAKVPRVNAVPRTYLEDLTGRTAGALVVYSDDSERVLVRCACGSTETRSRASALKTLRGAKDAHCSACSVTSAASKAPGAVRGVCSWDGKPAMVATKGAGAAYECEACQRRGSRNGRDADGRPIYRSKVAQ